MKIRTPGLSKEQVSVMVARDLTGQTVTELVDPVSHGALRTRFGPLVAKDSGLYTGAKQVRNKSRKPYVKHLAGDIWEIRPLRDRVLFAAWVNDGFVLLHYFVKKTQKTPKREID